MIAAMMTCSEEMAASICQRLINEVWKSYTDDLDEAPKEEGIYAIGFEEDYIYVGHSNNIRRRLREHKYQQLYIDEFIQEQFNEDGGINLGIKWVQRPVSTCVEGQYLECLKKKLGYWPKYNIKRGNKCN